MFSMHLPGLNCYLANSYVRINYSDLILKTLKFLFLNSKTFTVLFKPFLLYIYLHFILNMMMDRSI